ncbi:MAG: AraC family ligand binding domain-containing protein, partial [Clostridia bacterium]|nr:AraC family ligand binding domain-containing protein [Clostridia bacterium]
MAEKSNYIKDDIVKHMRINKLREFCHLHINPELEAVYLKAGTVTVTYDTENFTLYPGEAMFILPYHPHAFYRS